MKKFAQTRKENRQMRHIRSLKKIRRYANNPLRLIVTKTNANIFAQIVDDEKGITLVSSSSLQLNLKNGNKESCAKVGADLAQKALAKKITKIVFDRGGNKYHGRIAALAEAARKNGLHF